MAQVNMNIQVVHNHQPRQLVTRVQMIIGVRLTPALVSFKFPDGKVLNIPGKPKVAQK